MKTESTYNKRLKIERTILALKKAKLEARKAGEREKEAALKKKIIKYEIELIEITA